MRSRYMTHLQLCSPRALVWLAGVFVVSLTLASLSPPRLACAQELFTLPTPSVPAPPTTAAGGYRLLPLLTEYHGEERRGVRYLSPKERALHKVQVRDGKLWSAQGELLNAAVKRPSSLPKHAPVPPPLPAQAKALGYAIYVIDQAGRLYVSFESEKDKVHHSSLLAGAPVACAGELLVFQGELLLINNQSGHYRPPPKALEQAVDALTKAGLDMSKVSVKTYGVDL